MHSTDEGWGFDPGDAMLFKDIRVGDTIQRVLTKDDGSKVIIEGVVDFLNQSTAHSKGGILLGAVRDDNRPDAAIIFVNRPEPTVWEQAQVGDLLMIQGKSKYAGRSYVAVRLLTEKGWLDPHTNELITLSELEERATSSDVEKIDLRKCRNGNAS